VLCDRFVDSSIAYQGDAGGLGSGAVRALHEVGSHGFLPDRTLLLRLPEGEADRRAGSRDSQGADLIGGRGADYHRAVARAFASLAEGEPGRFRVIDASGTPEEVTRRLLDALEDLL
jgi:dTMP kinase